MSDERKKPLWPWAVVLPIWLPVLYAASFGPACWLADREIIPSVEFYRPLARIAARNPGQMRDACYWYAGYGSPKKMPDTVGYQMVLEEWRNLHAPMISRDDPVRKQPTTALWITAALVAVLVLLSTYAGSYMLIVERTHTTRFYPLIGVRRSADPLYHAFGKQNFWRIFRTSKFT